MCLSFFCEFICLELFIAACSFEYFLLLGVHFHLSVLFCHCSIFRHSFCLFVFSYVWEHILRMLFFCDSLSFCFCLISLFAIAYVYTVYTFLLAIHVYKTCIMSFALFICVRIGTGG